MQIRTQKVSDLVPYKNNPRKNDGAVDAVAASIKEFGFKVPIVVDKDNVIVTGHTRLKAAKKLGLKEVPTIIADDLSEEQIKAFRLADNKVGEIALWDNDLLRMELEELDFSMEDFGFEFDFLEPDYAEETQDRVENILNLGYGQYFGMGKYDIPYIKPETNIPPVKEWIGFNYATGEKDPYEKGVHFFIDDYQFERVWNDPEKYAEMLRPFRCVATPDFSPYSDMPLAAQIWNHYRKHWIGAFWQEHGVTVIPTIRGSEDPRSLEWFLDGEPRGGEIIVSAMWDDRNVEESKKSLEYVKKELCPTKIYVYGGAANKYGIYDGAEYELIPSFTQKRYGRV